MKKIFSIITVCSALFAAAQKTSFAIKANLIFPTDSGSWDNIKSTLNNAYDNSGKTNVGFNAGLSAKVDLGKFFVMPEIYYTTFNLSKDDTWNDFKENSTKDFTVGYQFGAQATISHFIANVKYEGAFSKDQRKFINAISGQEIRYDNRPNLVMVGVGYKF